MNYKTTVKLALKSAKYEPEIDSMALEDDGEWVKTHFKLIINRQK